LPEILGLFSETAGRNARQFEEEAIRKATLGWIDPTLPGKAEGEQYDTPGATIGGVAGGALPMIGAYALGNAVGGPVGGGIVTGMLPLIERRPDEPQYDIEQRAGEGLVQGATAGVLGPVGDASGAIAERIAPGSRLAELLLKGPMVTGATAALTPLGTGRPMTREQALQNLAFAYGMEVPGLIAGRSASPAEPRSPIHLSRNVGSREQRITGIDGEPTVVESHTEPRNSPLENAPALPQSAASAASTPGAYDQARTHEVLENAYRSGSTKHVYDAANLGTIAEREYEPDQVRTSERPGEEAAGADAPLDDRAASLTRDDSGTGNIYRFISRLRGADVGYPDVITEPFDYTKRDREQYKELKREYGREGRRQFLESLGNDDDKVAKLRKSGLSGEDISKIKRGLVPEEYEVHHKLPLDNGGTNSVDNLMLVRKDPYHRGLTNYQNARIRGMKVGETRTIAWPKFTGFLYSPSGVH
jgi:hypothetical protein